MHSFFFSLQHCVKAIKLIVPTVDVHRTGYPHDNMCTGRSAKGVSQCIRKLNHVNTTHMMVQWQ